MWISGPEEALSGVSSTETAGAYAGAGFSILLSFDWGELIKLIESVR